MDDLWLMMQGLQGEVDPFPSSGPKEGESPRTTARLLPQEKDGWQRGHSSGH